MFCIEKSFSSHTFFVNKNMCEGEGFVQISKLNRVRYSPYRRDAATRKPRWVETRLARDELQGIGGWMHDTDHFECV